MFLNILNECSVENWIKWMYLEIHEIVEVMKKKLILQENLVFFVHIENASLLTLFDIYKVCRKFSSSTLKGLENLHYLVPVNPIFDELPVDMRLLIYTWWKIFMSSRTSS